MQQWCCVQKATWHHALSLEGDVSGEPCQVSGPCGARGPTQINVLLIEAA